MAPIIREPDACVGHRHAAFVPLLLADEEQHRVPGLPLVDVPPPRRRPDRRPALRLPVEDPLADRVIPVHRRGRVIPLGLDERHEVMTRRRPPRCANARSSSSNRRRPLNLMKDTRKSIRSLVAISFLSSAIMLGSLLSPVKRELTDSGVSGRTRG